MALYDQLAMLLHLLHEALQLCRLMADCAPDKTFRSELTLLFDMIAALDCAALPPPSSHSHASR